MKMNGQGKRIIFDRSFTGLSIFSIILLSLSLVILLAPIFIRGFSAFFFKATIEHRRFLLQEFHRGDSSKVGRELALVEKSRQPVYDMLARFEKKFANSDASFRNHYQKPFKELKENVISLLGPAPNSPSPVLLRQKYGQTRWDRALIKLNEILYREEWDYSATNQIGKRKYIPRINDFRGTTLMPLFNYLTENIDDMLLPKPTFYWGFLTDKSMDAHFFGGIWPEFLGTIYLTIGAMLFAIPLGIMAAIYLAEFAGAGLHIRLLRTCISTLAGVPSIIFGLFGLAFIINTLKVSSSKSVLAGSLTLALLILPTIIRAAEEAIRSVPHTYKEASLSLGASTWQSMIHVTIPACLPGILTGIIIAIGRAAGETAPIIFTAAVSVGNPLKIWQTLTQPTPALPWNIYNLASEHEAIDQIRHVQYGMVLVLVLFVLLLNLSAIMIRARMSKKMKV